MAKQTMSVRLDDDARQRLRREAERSGHSPTGLAQRLIDEGLRMAAFPGIRFRRRASGGSSASLTPAPNVFTVVARVKHFDVPDGEDPIIAAATTLGVTEHQVRLAMDYYTAFPTEIDAEIEANERAYTEGKAQWERRQRLPS